MFTVAGTAPEFLKNKLKIKDDIFKIVFLDSNFVLQGTEFPFN